MSEVKFNTWREDFRDPQTDKITQANVLFIRAEKVHKGQIYQVHTPVFEESDEEINDVKELLRLQCEAYFYD